MKTVHDVMTANVIHVSPTNKIKTAIILMKGHNIGGLPVVDEDKVLGVLDYQDILGKDNDIPVQNIMDKEFVSVPPDMTVADAADLMAKINADRLLVMSDGHLIGLVTRGDLLPELGKSFDTLTDLPRADAMRDWGITALKSGNEVTVIFIDLDNFGLFNKKYGHIIGDKVLRHVAKVLQQNIDESRDILCRYAGDEYVIVTTRNASDARDLAVTLGEAIRNSEDPDIPEPVTGSIGVHGGKRTKEREDIHYNSTLDNLINLASKSCTVAKERKILVVSQNGKDQFADPEPVTFESQAVSTDGAVAEAVFINRSVPINISPSHQRRLKIQMLNFSWGDSSMATAMVELANGSTSVKQSKSGFALGNNALRLVADATAQAICEFLPAPGYGVVVENVHLIHSGPSEDVIVTTALLITPQNQMRVSGSSIVRHDIYRAVSASVLSAINRQISMYI